MVRAKADFILCILISVSFVGGVFCKKDVHVVSLKELQWGHQKSSSVLHHSSTSRSAKSTATVLEMKHQNPERKLHKLLLSDEFRVSSLQSRLKHAKSSQAQIPLTSGIALQTMNYIVNIKLGDNNMTLIVDTGSDLTWVQCKPCTICHAQNNPIYDPSVSPTYRSLPCNSTYCTSCACTYAVKYGDGSYTRGILAQERINLGGTNVESFVFGCGQSNQGLFGGTSGLLGLGQNSLSLISQTKKIFGGVFSYCLPSRNSNVSGNLVLGNMSYSTPIAYTRTLPGNAPYYILNNTGIRVGGAILDFSSGFRVLIDSGTVITRLAPSVYNAVKAEFVKQFSGYPIADRFSILDTCFDLSKNDYVMVPKIGLRFEGGVVMDVDVGGVFYSAKKDGSQVCLAIASLADDELVGIIGNFQQRNQRVVYDSLGSRVGFGWESCSYGV